MTPLEEAEVARVEIERELERERQRAMERGSKFVIDENTHTLRKLINQREKDLQDLLKLYDPMKFLKQFKRRTSMLVR